MINILLCLITLMPMGQLDSSSFYVESIEVQTVYDSRYIFERASRQRTRYDVVVRMDDGGFQTRGYDAAAPFHVGDRVRVAPDGFLRMAEADPR